jgi:hypothetical protein
MQRPLHLRRLHQLLPTDVPWPARLVPCSRPSPWFARRRAAQSEGAITLFVPPRNGFHKEVRLLAGLLDARDSKIHLGALATALMHQDTFALVGGEPGFMELRRTTFSGFMRCIMDECIKENAMAQAAAGTDAMIGHYWE